MKKSAKYFLTFIALMISLSVLTPENANAQCPMCRMSAESNMKNGGTAGKGLNKGILYLFFTPYIIIGTLGFLWWKHKKKQELIMSGTDQAE
ncbi:MAG: hypothetical protein IPI60_13090 [Saprospiraceae bacterium]|nr:hypothetical protein [Saprospiraceae bacterium]